MLKTFYLPDLGEGLAEATVHQWRVNIGQTVGTEDTLVSVETAKALVDIPVPFPGIIKTFFAKPGDVVTTKAPLVSIETRAVTKVLSEPTTAPSVVGRLATSPTLTKATSTQEDYKGPKVLPTARKLAMQANIDLAEITPSGPNGIITVKDVRYCIQNAASASSLSPPTYSVPQSMASAMATAHHSVAATTIMDEVILKAWKTDDDKTVRLIQAVIAACQVEPLLNAHFNAQSCQSTVMEDINLGVAVDSVQGHLYLPVIKKAQTQTASELREKVDYFKACAHKNHFPKAILGKPTLVFSNFGSIAGRYATPMVLPPSVATVGIGRIFKQCCLEDRQVVQYSTLPVSITIDHRSVTGGQVARFLKAFIQAL